MAEKYGEIPPRFTRAWWDYYWYYYRWHVVIILFAVVFTVFTCVQCASRAKYDMHISYVGHKIYAQDKLELLGEMLSPYIDDADGNGENSIFVQQLNISGAAGHEEYDAASYTKFDIEMQEDCSFLFLLDREMLENMLNRDYADELFLPVLGWTEDDLPEDMLVSKDGTPYAVSLENSKFMIENDIYHDDVYAVIRRNYKNNEKNQIAFEGSKKAAIVLTEQN